MTKFLKAVCLAHKANWIHHRLHENHDIISTPVLALSECQRQVDALPFRSSPLFRDLALVEQSCEFTVRGCTFEHIRQLPYDCIAEGWNNHFHCSRFARAAFAIS